MSFSINIATRDTTMMRLRGIGPHEDLGSSRSEGLSPPYLTQVLYRAGFTSLCLLHQITYEPKDW